MQTPKESLLAYKCQSSECGFYFVQKVTWDQYFCPKCKYTTRPIFDYYEIFGLEYEFTLTDLKERYKRLSLKYHPDQSKSKMSDDFITIRKGYEILSNETEKEIYDHELILLKNFVEGGEAPFSEKETVYRGGIIEWLILALVGILGGGMFYYYTQNPFFSILVLFVWLSASMIWKDHLLKGLSYLVETAVILGIGYTFFEKKWMETLILSLGFVTYYLIKKYRSR